MNRITIPNIAVKLGLPSGKARLQAAAVAGQSVLPQLITLTPLASAPSDGSRSFEHLFGKPGGRGPLHKQVWAFLQRHAFIVIMAGFLLAAAAAVRLYSNYWVNAHITQPAKSVKIATLPAKPITGFNTTVPADQLQSKLQSITGQPATLIVGTHVMPIGSDTIKSWLKISANKQKTEYYIHADEAAIAPSLVKLANKYVKSPVNQVTADENGVSRVVVGGRNGTALSDPDGLKPQAHEVAKNLLAGGGMQFNTSLADVPFQSVTPAAFDKVLIANVTSKQMWAYQNGQLVHSFLVSAGKPSTPTPLGEFHVYAKLTVQDMRGTNPDGTPYFQPKVPWVSYFYSGSAVHGVYWHPLSWFGVNNSSHGCVGLPVDEAKWVYDWAPIGTTVITHS